jgi:hypothetical protein
VPTASATNRGALSSTDWTTFNNKLTTVTVDAPLTGSGTSASHLSIPAATTSVNGYLTSTDWNTFNGKQPAGTYVNSVSGTTNQITASTVSGAVTVSLPTSVTTGQYIGNQSITGSSTQGAFAYGTLGYSDVNHILTMASSQNSYIQMEIQNTNAGASASSDVIVGNNNTTSNTYYGDFGMNSSGWAGTGAFNSPNAVYLTATTGDLALGTTTANSIRFAVNGGTTDAMTINSSGSLAVNGSYGTSGQVLTSAGSGSAPTWAAVASSNITAQGLYENSNTISANYTIGTGNNAMSAGPITISTGFTVTVPTGSTWTIV